VLAVLLLLGSVGEANGRSQVAESPLFDEISIKAREGVPALPIPRDTPEGGVSRAGATASQLLHRLCPDTRLSACRDGSAPSGMTSRPLPRVRDRRAARNLRR
jgi:hypothetical protein